MRQYGGFYDRPSLKASAGAQGSSFVTHTGRQLGQLNHATLVVFGADGHIVCVFALLFSFGFCCARCSTTAYAAHCAQHTLPAQWDWKPRTGLLVELPYLAATKTTNCVLQPYQLMQSSLCTLLRACCEGAGGCMEGGAVGTADHDSALGKSLSFAEACKLQARGERYSHAKSVCTLLARHSVARNLALLQLPLHRGMLCQRGGATAPLQGLGPSRGHSSTSTLPPLPHIY